MKTRKDKCSYLWEYYKVPILGIPLLLLFLYYCISSFTAPKEDSFYLYFMNDTIPNHAKKQLETDLQPLLTECGLNALCLDDTLTITPDTPDHESQMLFTTAISGHMVDVMIADETFFNYYAGMNALADLSLLLPNDFYDQLSPYLIYGTDSDGVSHAYGIDISTCSALSDFGLDAPILTIAKVSEHNEANISFLKYLFK